MPHNALKIIGRTLRGEDLKDWIKIMVEVIREYFIRINSKTNSSW